LRLTKRIYDYVFEDEDRENFVVKTYPTYDESNEENISYIDSIWEARLYTEYDNLVNMFNYYTDEDYALEKVDMLFDFDGNFKLIKEVYKYKGYKVIIFEIGDTKNWTFEVWKNNKEIKNDFMGYLDKEKPKQKAKRCIDKLEENKNEIIEYKGYEIELTLKDKLNNLFTFKIFNQNGRLIEKLFGATDKTTAKKNC
jgi:hypothetical protein